jgi:hypothetical protein
MTPPVSPPDRLAETVRLWIADDRPAWETAEAFERDVALALEGRSDTAERMAMLPGALVVDPLKTQRHLDAPAEF